jgi:hypothetical protein
MEEDRTSKGHVPLFQHGRSLLPRPGLDAHHMEIFVHAIRGKRQLGRARWGRVTITQTNTSQM